MGGNSTIYGNITGGSRTGLGTACIYNWVRNCKEYYLNYNWFYCLAC